WSLPRMTIRAHFDGKVIVPDEPVEPPAESSPDRLVQFKVAGVAGFKLTALNLDHLLKDYRKPEDVIGEDRAAQGVEALVERAAEGGTDPRLGLGEARVGREKSETHGTAPARRRCRRIRARCWRKFRGNDGSSHRSWFRLPGFSGVKNPHFRT